MSITAEEKQRLMKEFATKDGDTGPVVAHRDADGTFQIAQERQPFPPRPSDDGRPAPEVAGLCEDQG